MGFKKASQGDIKDLQTAIYCMVRQLSGADAPDLVNLYGNTLTDTLQNPSGTPSMTLTHTAAENIRHVSIVNTVATTLNVTITLTNGDVLPHSIPATIAPYIVSIGMDNYPIASIQVEEQDDVATVVTINTMSKTL